MDKGLIGWQIRQIFRCRRCGTDSRARVAALHLSGGMRRRVQDLGLVPGTRVTCVRRALSGDRSRTGYAARWLPLRKCDAAQIEVQP